MQSTSKFTHLVSQVYTLHQLHERMQFLKSYLKSQIFGDKDSSFNSDDMTWLSAQPADLTADITKDNLDKVFEDLEKQAKELKTLVIFTATDFPPATIKDLALKVRKDFGENFLIDLKSDPNLIAGCALVWNGVYRDYSLRGKMNEKKEDILSILKKWK